MEKMIMTKSENNIIKFRKSIYNKDSILSGINNYSDLSSQKIDEDEKYYFIIIKNNISNNDSQISDLKNYILYNSISSMMD